MLVPDRASIRGLAGNHLIISCLLIILGSFCAEDYTHFAVYQPLTNQPQCPVLSETCWPITV